MAKAKSEPEAEVIDPDDAPGEVATTISFDGQRVVEDAVQEDGSVVTTTRAATVAEQAQFLADDLRDSIVKSLPSATGGSVSVSGSEGTAILTFTISG